MIEPPKSQGRAESFDLAIKLLRKPCPLIVEIGMTRLPNNWNGDGWSTILFGYTAAQTGGKLISIDINVDYLPVAKRILDEYQIPQKNVFLVCADAMDFIDTFDFERVDLLYLDAWDYTGPQEALDDSMNKHMMAFLKAQKWLKSGSLVLIDDVHDTETYAGKGRYLIPHLKEQGYELCHVGYQFLFRKP